MLKILHVFGICLFFISCNSWLTIDPKDQIAEEDLFSTADGFYTQLDGVYKSMATQGMYGQELSWGFLDVLAQYYNTSETNNRAYKEAAQYGYDIARVKSITKKFWTEGFNIIANCNVLIKHALSVDSTLFSLEERERNLILGEAYGARALMHFDLLRLFAPSMKQNSKAKVLPYVKDFPVYFPEKVTSEVFLENVISDLEKAHDLVKEYDWNKMERVRDLNYRLELASLEGNRFLEYRGYRLNFWAIKCLLARVYMYQGNEQKALEYAQEIIKLHEEEDWADFTSRDDVEKESNFKYYDDVYFALYNNELKDYPNGLFEEEHFLCMQDLNGLFSDVDKKYDYRYLAWEEHPKYNEEVMLPQRVKEVVVGKGRFGSKMIPMIRLSEMYYIAAEAIYNDNPELAQKYVYRVARARGSRAGVPGYTTKDEFIKNVILKDLRREVYGEGQLFFFYKRHHLPIIVSGRTTRILNEEFVLPTPEKDEQISM